MRTNACWALAVVAGASLAGCETTPTPEVLREREITRVSAEPDAVFRAARAYYGRNKYEEHVLDTDARLATFVLRHYPRKMISHWEVVWVRPAAGGGSDLRLKAVWGPGYRNSDRAAAVAAGVEEELRGAAGGPTR
ncbi:MAG: hypothetical protein IT437_01555 [Phycisphaerales bacterium]|nr:hypothetical protein [Phycisphaerales bacterium]